MDYSTDQIVDIAVFLFDNKLELSIELRTKFTKNINQRQDFPTGIYLSTFDHKLEEKMKQHLVEVIMRKFNINVEQGLILAEDNNILKALKEIIKESYE